jgi:hypothetical protein
MLKRIVTILARLVPKSCKHRWVKHEEFVVKQGNLKKGGGTVYICSKCKAHKTEKWGDW